MAQHLEKQGLQVRGLVAHPEHDRERVLLQQWMLQHGQKAGRRSQDTFEVLAGKYCISRKRRDFGRDVIDGACRRTKAPVARELPGYVVLREGRLCWASRFWIQHALRPEFLGRAGKKSLQCRGAGLVQPDMKQHAPPTWREGPTLALARKSDKVLREAPKLDRPIIQIPRPGGASKVHYTPGSVVARRGCRAEARRRSGERVINMSCRPGRFSSRRSDPRR